MFALRGDQVPPQYPIVNVHVPERTLHDIFASVAPMGSFIRSGIERARQTDGWTGVCAAVCNARRCDQALILIDSSEKRRYSLLSADRSKAGWKFRADHKHRPVVAI